MFCDQNLLYCTKNCYFVKYLITHFSKIGVSLVQEFITYKVMNVQIPYD